jgi:hypothetical protein
MCLAVKFAIKNGAASSAQRKSPDLDAQCQCTLTQTQGHEVLHQVPEVFSTCSVEVAPAMRIIYDRVASFFSLLYRVMGGSGLLTRQGRCGAALRCVPAHLVHALQGGVACAS